MVFCFHCYHQKDWWRLTHSYDLGTKAKQKKCWLLVLIRVEKSISQLSFPVFPSSVRAVLFSHCISHTQQWNLIVCWHQGSFIGFMSTERKSSGISVAVVKCCVMDYLLMQWIFPGSLAPSHLQPRKTGQTLLNKIPAEGRSSCAFHCSCVRAVGTTPCRTKSQHRHSSKGEIQRPATERVWDVLVHVSVQEESSQLLFLVGS